MKQWRMNSDTSSWSRNGLCSEPGIWNRLAQAARWLIGNGSNSRILLKASPDLESLIL